MEYDCLNPGYFAVWGLTLTGKELHWITKSHNLTFPNSSKTSKTLDKCIEHLTRDVVQHLLIAGSCRPLIVLFINNCNFVSHSFPLLKFSLQNIHFQVLNHIEVHLQRV